MRFENGNQFDYVMCSRKQDPSRTQKALTNIKNPPTKLNQKPSTKQKAVRNAKTPSRKQEALNQATIPQE